MLEELNFKSAMHVILVLVFGFDTYSGAKKYLDTYTAHTNCIAFDDKIPNQVSCAKT